jgi:hypothetical protein
MNKSKAWQTPVIIVGLILFSAVLTATWRTISNSFAGGESASSGSGASIPLPQIATSPDEPVILDLEGLFPSLAPDYFFQVEAIQGMDQTPIPSLAVLGILTAVAFGGIVAVGLLLMVLLRAADRNISKVKEDQEFVKAVNNLERGQQEMLRAKNQAAPANPKPSGVMPRWSALSTALVATVLAFFLGTVVGSAVSETAQPLYANGFAIVAFAITFYAVRPTNVFEVDKTDNDTSPWGIIWIIVSGAIVVGLGMGFMFAVINGQDPFPFLDGAWWQENIILPLTS